MQDVVSALRQYLLSHSEVTDLVGTRIWGGVLPQLESRNMPRNNIVIQASPGGFGRWQRTYIRAGNNRMDLRCYGGDIEQAYAIYRAVHPLLCQLRRGVVTGTLLYDVTPLIEAATLIEPDTKWPFAFASYNVLAAWDAAAS